MSALLARGVVSLVDEPADSQPSGVANIDPLRRARARQGFEHDGRAFAAEELLELPESVIRVLFIRGLVGIE